MKHLSVGAMVSLCVAAAPFGLPAQAVFPEPQWSRFEEWWSAESASRSPWYTAKHVVLAPNDAAWLTLAGSARWRAEDDRNYQFSTAPAGQGDFTTTRTLLSADLHVGNGRGLFARGFAEFRDAQGYHRTLPGGVRSNELDRHDWQNAFAEAGWGASSVRVGTQDLALGRERLIGPSDWTNARRTFAGARVIGRFAGLTLDAFDGRVLVVRSLLPNQPDTASRLRFVAIGTSADRPAAVTLRPASWQLYALWSSVSSPVPQARATYGTRLVWKAPLGGGTQVSGELEAASQGGNVGPKGVCAWFLTTDVGVALRKAPMRPSLSLGYDAASGDRSPTDNYADAFTALYASSHSHGGIADAFGRANVDEWRAALTAQPAAPVQLAYTLRSFTRRELLDGVYNKQNTLFRAAGNSRARDVAVEHDFTASVRVSAMFRFQSGIAVVLPGAFLEQTTGGGQIQRFAFASTTVTY